MQPLMTMRDALEDPDTFGAILPGETWKNWRILLIASRGESLTADELEIFTMLTGRTEAPTVPCDELWGVIGRRGGKTRAFAVGSCYFATQIEYEEILAPGERGMLPIMAASTWQANKALSYVRGVFDNVPRLGEMVINQTADMISLSTSVDIEVRPANMNTIRSGTAVAAVADEVAFWRSDRSSKNPDHEILDAVRPCLATTGGPLFVMSSPYARKGELYKTFKANHGPGGDRLVIVARAASRVMNETLRQAVVDRALERDRSKARAEYLAEFREDIEDYVSADVLDSCTAKGIIRREPKPGVRYSAFVDPAGGSGQDSMTLAISHEEGNKRVLDLVEEIRPPFSPEAVTKSFCAILKSYGVNKVRGDRYAGEWPRERFKTHHVDYELSDLSKSEIYLAALTFFNSGQADMLDMEVLRDQLLSLERRTSRGSRDTIDHPSGEHDDVANAAAGAILEAGTGSTGWTAETVDGFARLVGRMGREQELREQLGMPPWAMF